MNTVTRPPLRWHGGKWRLAPWIVAQFPAHTCYVEPFGGGASILLRKERTPLDVYNDLDHAMVTLFRLLRDQPADLIRRVELIPFARAEFDLAQDFGTEPEDEIDLCLRLLVRSHMGFSTAGACGRGAAEKTGFRGRSIRSGTTPPENWRRFPNVLREVAGRLQGVVIECRPALDLIAMHDHEETLFYLDPPYLPETRDPRPNYTHEMTRADHRNLLACIRDVKARVVLSGYASDLYDRTLVGWHHTTRATRAEGARPRTEHLWMNFDPAAVPPPGGLFDPAPAPNTERIPR